MNKICSSAGIGAALALVSSAWAGPEPPTALLHESAAPVSEGAVDLSLRVAPGMTQSWSQTLWINAQAAEVVSRGGGRVMWSFDDEGRIVQKSAAGMAYTQILDQIYPATNAPILKQTLAKSGMPVEVGRGSLKEWRAVLASTIIRPSRRVSAGEEWTWTIPEDKEKGRREFMGRAALQSLVTDETGTFAVVEFKVEEAGGDADAQLKAKPAASCQGRAMISTRTGLVVRMEASFTSTPMIGNRDITYRALLVQSEGWTPKTGR